MTRNSLAPRPRPRTMRRRPARRPGALWIGTLAAGSLLAVPASPAGAQETADERVAWEIGLAGGVIDDRPEFSADEGDPRLAHEGIVGGRLAAHLPSRFFLEAEVLYSPLELVTDDGAGSRIDRLDGLLVLGGAGYLFPLGPELGLHLRSGLGFVRWNAEPESETDFLFNAGAGLRLRIADAVGLRADGRWHLAPSALATTRRALTPSVEARGEPLWLIELSGGLSVYLGP